MKPQSITCLLTVLLAVVLAGCASAPRRVSVTSSPAVRYEVEPGRDAATIADMRAAPAPAVPELVAATKPATDRSRLLAQGFIPIGHASLRGDETAARSDAVRQGQAVGAERILFYAPTAQDGPAPASGTTAGEWLASYYVRFQLPFGATFRDLNSKETQQLDRAGVRIGSVINGTPAAKANLLAGDVVVSLDGTPIRSRSEFRSMLRVHAGHAVVLGIIRNGGPLDRTIRLGVAPTVGGH